MEGINIMNHLKKRIAKKSAILLACLGLLCFATPAVTLAASTNKIKVSNVEFFSVIKLYYST